MNVSSSAALTAHIEVAAYLSPGELVDGAPLFSAGIIDSVNLIELITYVEDHYQIRVPAEDVTLENWDSVEKILAYIVRKRGN